jgi:hypothetical protein
MSTVLEKSQDAREGAAMLKLVDCRRCREAAARALCRVADHHRVTQLTMHVVALEA